MSLYKKQQKEADDQLFKKTGKYFKELDPDGFYDVEIFEAFIQKYTKASYTGEKALLTLGKRIPPHIKKTQGIPPDIDTALKLILFSAKQFAYDHQGLSPIKIMRAKEGEVHLRLPNIGYNCLMIEGVYLGILNIFGIKTGKIDHKKCIKKGNSCCEFIITWL